MTRARAGTSTDSNSKCNSEAFTSTEDGDGTWTTVTSRTNKSKGSKGKGHTTSATSGGTSESVESWVSAIERMNCDKADLSSAAKAVDTGKRQADSQKGVGGKGGKQSSDANPTSA